MSATDTKSLVDRFANDDLKENYALKVFPPILLMIMMSADELNPVKLCVLPDVVPLTLRTSPHAPHLTHSPHAPHLTHLTSRTSPHAPHCLWRYARSFCVYTGMETQHCLWVLVLTLIVMSFLERMAVAYYATRAFLQAIQTVFFNSVDVIGLQNVPLEGPVIFVGNHCNQFADGIMLVMNARRKVTFRGLQPLARRAAVRAMSPRRKGCAWRVCVACAWEHAHREPVRRGISWAS